MAFETLEKLDYSERVAHVARAFRDSANRQVLFKALEGGEAGHRRLAMLGAGICKDHRRLLAGLGDPSVAVRRSAAGWVARLVAPAAVVASLDGLDPGTQAHLQHAALRLGRKPLIRALIDHARTTSDQKALLSLQRGADPELARSLVDELDVHAIDLGRLAAHQPELALDILTDGLDATAPAGRQIWWNKTSAWRALAEIYPERCLDLLERYAPTDAVPTAFGAAASRLMRRAQARTVDFLLGSGRAAALAVTGVPKGVLARIKDLDASRLNALAARLVNAPERLAALLSALAPSKRVAVFEAAVAGIDVRARVWPWSLMVVLPAAVRQREADRVCLLPNVCEDVLAYQEWSSFRAFAQAHAVLDEARKSAQADERATAWSLLVNCASRDTDHAVLVSLIEGMTRLENEQDPVRMAVWEALANLPPSRFNAAHLPGLEALTSHTLDARDTSHTTRAAIQRLATALLVRDAAEPKSRVFAFALKTLGRLAGQHAYINFPVYWPSLPKGAELSFCEVVLPWVEAGNRRELRWNIMALARSLGHRAWNVARLQKLLEDTVINGSRSDAIAAGALWLESPKTRDERVRLLLDRDDSAIVINRVFEHLHLRRTSWLDPFLTGETLKGKYTSGRTIWLPPAEGGFHRWTARQQKAMAKLLCRQIKQHKEAQYNRTLAIRRLAALPCVRVADFKPYLDSPKVPLVEAALGALVWLDEPTPALPVLLEHVDTSRARVAMYALPRLLKLVPRTLALDTIETLLARDRLKITVHKEALRLLGSLGGQRGFEILRTADGPNLHRDVRIALMHAARQFLDHPKAWDLLRSAARADRSTALAMLAPQPHTMAPRHRHQYLHLMLSLADHPDQGIRGQLFAMLSRHTIDGRDWTAADPFSVAQAASRQLLAVDPDPTLGRVANTLASIAYHDAAQDLIIAAVDTLRAGAEQESTSPSLADDLPRFRRLSALLGALLSSQHDREAWAPIRQRVAAHLDGFVPSWPERVGLIGLSLDWKQADVVIPRLTAIHIGGESAEFVRELERTVPAHWLPQELAMTVDALMADPSPSLRKFALSFVREAGLRTEWASSWLTRLVALRDDPDAQISAAARRVQVRD